VEFHRSLVDASLWFEPVAAVGNELVTLIITSLAYSANYLRQKRIYVRSGLVLARATTPEGDMWALLLRLSLSEDVALADLWSLPDPGNVPDGP